MFIGYFTERPYQDPKAGIYGTTARTLTDLGESNAIYDPKVGADLYNRYLDEKLYAEEMGFDGLMLNEHHSTPFCMGGVVNVEAAILARITKRAKIVILGNVIPIWDDPLWLAESIAEIDMISYGRVVSGWVRGTARESVAHNAVPPYNFERFQEAHDFIIKAWTEPGPFRWEGKHYHYLYVNPWYRPYQKPHPPIWIPGTVSVNTMRWAAERQYPYIMLATDLEATRQSFELYHKWAREEFGFESGPQHIGYLFKVHVDETEELAYETGRKYVQGPSNPFLLGNEGIVRPEIMNLPGFTARTTQGRLPTGRSAGLAAGRQEPGQQRPAAGGGGAGPGMRRVSYDEQLARYQIIVGTPDNVILKVRHVLETLRPGSIFFWDGDGAMTHEDAMRSLRLFGEYVIPAVREIGKELELFSPFDFDPVPGMTPGLTGVDWDKAKEEVNRPQAS